VRQVLGERAVGICDSPSGLCRRVAAAVGRPAEELWFDYFGLNHLGWLKGVRDRDGATHLLEDLLEDDQRLAGFEEGRLFGGEWLRSLGMIPNEYLYYFYYATDTVKAIRGNGSRGAFLLSQQRAFYAQNGHSPEEALAAWRATRHDRERTYMAEARNAAGDQQDHEPDANSGYESEAMAVLEAIALNTRAVLILNTANRSSLPFLDERAVVEVPCLVGAAGPVPVSIGNVSAHARSLIETMKDVERTAIDAALLGSERLAIRALALHPLVPSVNTAREIFDGYKRRLPALQEAFA
jgi:6-phospho-beta-glucosidase